VRYLATDGPGNLYLLVDPGTLAHKTVEIRKIAPSENSTRLTVGDAYNGGPFTADRHGNTLVVMGGVFVYKIAPNNDPDTAQWAGSPGRRLSVTGPIDSIASDASNHVYLANGPDITQVTFAGDKVHFASIPRRRKTSASHEPLHIASTPDGTLFVSDSSSNSIFKVSPDKILTLLAGTPGKAGAVDGPGDKARFKSPQGVAVDSNGTIYVADSGNQTVRRISPSGEVTTFAGKPGKRGTVDGRGAAARLDRPTSIAVDSGGTLYIANGEDNLIRKISPEGVVSTINAQQFIDAP
jgi:hypothetical protein